MAGRGRSQGGTRPRARVDAAVVPFPRRRTSKGSRLALSRLAPSGRSLLLGFALLAATAGAYAAARETSVFAVRSVDVRGARPAVAAQVEQELAPALGQSLLAVDLERLRRRAEALPTVLAVSFDRAFPHTLRIVVTPERPVAVARQGAGSWLVSARGRVMGELERGARRGLPRLWLKRNVKIEVGGLFGGDTASAVRAVAPLARKPLPGRVSLVRVTPDELTLVQRSGLEVRLGDASDLALKLAVARRILPALAGVGGYLDVSVPERPVAGQNLNSQVEVESIPSTAT
ncbi:MAG: FtsQ-type POTRA domain-containing protein [Actinobacteria bacterium]|nr:FtsQ-type POTRA domain-containing protein [Actinomycetota bacterium]